MRAVADWIDDLAGDLRRIAEGTHHDPHGVLGARTRGGRSTVLVHLPDTAAVIIDGRHEMQRGAGSDFFRWQGPPGSLSLHYRLSRRDGRGGTQERIAPYSFFPTIGPQDLTAFSGGFEARAWQFLGAQLMQVDGVSGVRFAVWAPNAARVSVVGPFCDWDGRRYPLRSLASSGVWEIFIPGLAAGELYKFELRHRSGGTLALKTHPYGRASELRPGTASIVCDSHYGWDDAGWLQARRQPHPPPSPFNILQPPLRSP